MRAGLLPAEDGSMAEPGGGNSTALAIQTRGLVKRFGQRAAVAGTDLAVPRGSVFGFLGPNGSGKTTTIRMLLGLVSPDQGSITVLGKDMPQGLASVLPDVGALVEGPGFYPFLSGEGICCAWILPTGMPRRRPGRGGLPQHSNGLAWNMQPGRRSGPIRWA